MSNVVCLNRASVYASSKGKANKKERWVLLSNSLKLIYA